MKNNEEIIDGWSRLEAEPTSALRAGDVATVEVAEAAAAGAAAA